MNLTDRHVRRLRLVCRSEDHARHGVVLLEDALRTASLGDEARFVVVRSLHLGKLPLQASAVTWRLRLEQRMQCLQHIAVEVDHPSARSAPAVVFRGETDFWVRLALQSAQGNPCHEWYWAAAVRGWRPSPVPAENLRFAFRNLAQHGLAATLELARQLHAGGRLEVLVGQLQPADLSPIAAQLAPVTASEPDITGAARPTPPGLDGRAGAARFRPVAAASPAVLVLAPWIQRWGGADLRVRWLATALRVLVGSSALAPVRPTSDGNGAAPQGRDLGADRAARPVPVPRDAARDSRRNGLGPTAAGGLFFAVHLLRRTGFPEHLTRLRDADRQMAPLIFLEFLLRHARIPAEDVSWRIISDAEELLRVGGVEPRSGLVATPDAGAVESPKGGVLRPSTWLLAADRARRRVAVMPLRSLVRRPALISATGTHIDVFFRPGEADLGIRRAGLDLDPGWVPWLQRVVTFHFNRDD